MALQLGLEAWGAGVRFVQTVRIMESDSNSWL